MSAFDPLAALASGAPLQQSALAAIDLGVQIEILQAQLTVGDLLTATILPPQGGSDRLSLLGQTVLAQLPPGIDPGQSLLLQVTGFAGNQILVRNLGVVDPSNPPATAQVELPPATAGAPTTATLTTVSTPPEAPSVPAAPAQTSELPSAIAHVPPPGPTPGNVAPPWAVFVAASVRPPPGAPPESSAPVVLAGDESDDVPAAPAVAAQVPPAVPAAQLDQAAAAAGTPAARISTALGLEARIVVTRAAAIDLAELVNMPARPGSASAAAQSGALAASESGSPLPIAGSSAAASLEAARAGTAADAPAAPLPATEEAALLTRLRVPANPLTLAAARMAGEAARMLPRALAQLDQVLARVTGGDPRAATVRAQIDFATRLNPSNPQALPERLMAYVANVVEGPEGKLASLVRALLAGAGADDDEPGSAPASERVLAQRLANDAPVDEAPPASASPADDAASAVPAQSGSAASTSPSAAVPAAAGQSALADSQAPQSLTALGAAAAVERSAALSSDLKVALLSLLESPPAGAPAGLASALSAALTAVTAVQLNALTAQTSDPAALTMALPMVFHPGGQPVVLRIAREAPGKRRLDADNFHIAFILDTHSLGTVAVDVQTVGRAVRVDVKTEHLPAAQRFQSTLDDLRSRLEQLRYRVASIAAGVVAPRAVPFEPPAVERLERGGSKVDLRA